MTAAERQAVLVALARIEGKLDTTALIHSVRVGR